MRKTTPFFPLEGHKPGFDFPAHVKNMMGELPPTGWMASSPGEIPPACKHYQQSGTLPIDRLSFYAMASLEGHRAGHASRLLDGLPSGVLRIGPITSESLTPLLDPANWFDGVHPTGPGARLFTDWLADKLVETGKGNSPADH